MSGEPRRDRERLADVMSSGVMSLELPTQHLQIVRYAVYAGWFGWDTALQWLLHIGQTKSLSELTPEQIWVGSSLLTMEQLEEATRGKKVTQVKVLSRATSSMVATLNASFEPSIHHSYETLVALPSVTMLRKQSEKNREQQEKLLQEIGSIESSPVLLQSTRQMRTEEFSSLAHSSSPSEMEEIVEEASVPSLVEYEATEVFTRRTIRADDLPDADEAPTHDEPPLLAQRSDATFDPLRERYDLGVELGSGGGGRVVRAFDRVLGRYVAMKIMRADVDQRAERLTRFMAEAQTTGQLEHPNIVPIYDFGTLTSGDPYYTMREVRNSSLRRVLAQIKQEDEETITEYSLQRLINLLKQVCQAISYAHDQGVIHRDLKPDNIMLGDYGEVLLMDWGLARFFDNALSSNDLALSAEGKTMGTPAYMPPEQAQGDLENVDELSDVYSLGAILYEVLTLEPPYVGTSPLAVMIDVVEGDLVPPSVRAPFREIPEELEKICLRALSPRKHLRFKSAKALYEALNEWSEGLLPREAERRATDGEAWGRRYRMLRKESEALMSRVRETVASMPPWAEVEHKRKLWSLEDRLHRFNLESARAFGHAAANFTKALVYVPDHTRARDGLADLYWARYEQAREENDPVNALYFKALIAQYDDSGDYTHLLGTQRSITITTNPEYGVELATLPIREQDRRFVTHGERQNLGPSPRSVEQHEQGRCMILATREGAPPVQLPMLFDHRTPATLHIEVPPESAYLDGFVYVPGGPFISGGDPNAFHPVYEEVVEMKGFFCSIYPITFREYLEWLDALHQVHPDRAREHVPMLRNAEGPLAYFDEAQQRWTPDDVLIEGSARDRYPEKQGHEWNLPVIGISAFDAEAFASWKGEQTGFPLRLPAARELEKAGRGTDGRFYTWGNRFDATFCKMRLSRREPSQLEPVGTFQHDVSPYGVRDLSGGVQEWCRSDREGAEDCPVFGGSWGQDERASRLANRVRVLANARTSYIGMRLVYSLEE